MMTTEDLDSIAGLALEAILEIGIRERVDLIDIIDTEAFCTIFESEGSDIPFRFAADEVGIETPEHGRISIWRPENATGPIGTILVISDRSSDRGWPMSIVGRYNACLVVDPVGFPGDRERSLIPPTNAVLLVDTVTRSTNGYDSIPGGRENIIPTPVDLTELGIRITDIVDGWRGNTNQTIIYVTVLEELLDRFDPSSVFRFVHLLGSLASSTDGFVQFHLDRSGIDPTIANRFETLFDVIFEIAPE